MGTKTIRLDEGVYEKIKDKKRDDETFSEAVDRLTSEWTLLDFAGGSSDQEADRHRELLRESEAAAATEREELLEQFEGD